MLEQNDFDMTKAMTDPDFVAVGSELDSDEFNAATDRLDEYERTVCGITESSSGCGWGSSHSGRCGKCRDGRSSSSAAFDQQASGR